MCGAPTGARLLTCTRERLTLSIFTYFFFFLLSALVFQTHDLNKKKTNYSI